MKKIPPYCCNVLSALHILASFQLGRWLMSPKYFCLVPYLYQYFLRHSGFCLGGGRNKDGTLGEYQAWRWKQPEGPLSPAVEELGARRGCRPGWPKCCSAVTGQSTLWVEPRRTTTEACREVSWLAEVSSHWDLCRVPSALLEELPKQPFWEIFGHQCMEEVAARRLLKSAGSLSTGEISWLTEGEHASQGRRFTSLSQCCSSPSPLFLFKLIDCFLE